MGVHQFELRALPRCVDPANHPDGGFLISHQLSAPILTRLRQLLPRDNSWGDTEEFTSESKWGSDLRIWKNAHGIIDDVVFRFAPIGNDLSLLRTFLKIMADANCRVYVSKSHNILEPDVEAVLPMLEDSEAWRFIKDPERALIQAAESIKKQEN